MSVLNCSFSAAPVEKVASTPANIIPAWTPALPLLTLTGRGRLVPVQYRNELIFASSPGRNSNRSRRRVQAYPARLLTDSQDTDGTGRTRRTTIAHPGLRADTPHLRSCWKALIETCSGLIVKVACHWQ